MFLIQISISMTQQKAGYVQTFLSELCTWMLNHCRCDKQMLISNSRISATLGGASLICRKHQMFCILSPLAETTDWNSRVHMKKLFQEFLQI